MKKITTRTTVSEIVALLREDGFADAAREAGYRDSDPLPGCKAHERPTREAVDARASRALRRTASEIRRAARAGALVWTHDVIRTTDASALYLRAVPSLEDCYP